MMVTAGCVHTLCWKTAPARGWWQMVRTEISETEHVNCTLIPVPQIHKLSGCSTKAHCFTFRDDLKGTVLSFI